MQEIKEMKTLEKPSYSYSYSAFSFTKVGLGDGRVLGSLSHFEVQKEWWLHSSNSLSVIQEADDNLDQGILKINIQKKELCDRFLDEALRRDSVTEGRSWGAESLEACGEQDTLSSAFYVLVVVIPRDWPSLDTVEPWTGQPPEVHGD